MKRANWTLRVTVLAFLVVLGGISVAVRTRAKSSPAARSTVTFQLTSTGFETGQSIPARFTCSGENVSPPLHWSGAPAGTRSFVLIMDDPDAPAGVWVHWVLYDLPASQSSLPSLSAAASRLPGGGLEGRNNFRKIGYGGPCPPPGRPHRYFFRLYALTVNSLSLPPGATRQQVDDAMRGKILGEAELMGTFGR